MLKGLPFLDYRVSSRALGLSDLDSELSNTDLIYVCIVNFVHEEKDDLDRFYSYAATCLYFCGKEFN